jgi:hemerythrin superfamily protein
MTYHRMDPLVSKGPGKVKGVKARADGFVGVFKTLAAQHGAISILMQRMQERPEKKPELWPEIRRELISHERGEMRAVYPVLREYAQTRVLAAQHALELGELEDLIDEIDAAQAEDWGPRYDQLVDVVLRHVDREEQHIFPKAQRAIGEQMAKELDARFLAVKNSTPAG